MNELCYPRMVLILHIVLCYGKQRWNYWLQCGWVSWACACCGGLWSWLCAVLVNLQVATLMVLRGVRRGVSA